MDDDGLIHEKNYSEKKIINNALLILLCCVVFVQRISKSALSKILLQNLNQLEKIIIFVEKNLALFALFALFQRTTQRNTSFLIDTDFHHNVFFMRSLKM